MAWKEPPNMNPGLRTKKDISYVVEAIQEARQKATRQKQVLLKGTKKWKYLRMAKEAFPASLTAITAFGDS